MKQRVITAALALLLFIPLTLYGDWPFMVFIYLIASIGLWELIKMKNGKPYFFPLLLAIILLWTVLSPATFNGALLGHHKIEVTMIMTFLLLSYTVLKKNQFTFDDASFIVMATLYVGMGFSYFLETRYSTDGLAMTFFVLFIVWGTDTGAYFVGRQFGNRKLWPEISPNKTVEGAIGGIVVATLVAVIFHLVHPFAYSFVTIVGVAILASGVGQIGDLVESAFKRYYDVKDSGNILPGHGGILDRFDSMLFVFPFLHFIQFIF